MVFQGLSSYTCYGVFSNIPTPLLNKKAIWILHNVMVKIVVLVMFYRSLLLRLWVLLLFLNQFT